MASLDTVFIMDMLALIVRMPSPLNMDIDSDGEGESGGAVVGATAAAPLVLAGGQFAAAAGSAAMEELRCLLLKAVM